MRIVKWGELYDFLKFKLIVKTNIHVCLKHDKALSNEAFKGKTLAKICLNWFDILSGGSTANAKTQTSVWVFLFSCSLVFHCSNQNTACRQLYFSSGAGKYCVFLRE